MNVCVVLPALPSDGVYDTVIVLQLVAVVAVSAQVGAVVGQTPPFCQSKRNRKSFLLGESLYFTAEYTNFAKLH